MLFETKVLDSVGNVKKVISGEELKRRHWKNFWVIEKDCNSFAKKVKKGNSRNGLKKDKSNLDNLGDETY